MGRKRFTDADKWEDGWFCDLPSPVKLFWMYLCDRCDHAGVWEVNWRLAQFHLVDMVPSEVTAALKDKIQVIKGGKAWFIPRFISFQYPTGLSTTSPAHKRIRATMISHGINPDTLVYTLSNRVCNTPEEEDEDKDKDSLSFSRERSPEEHDGVCAPYPAGDKRVYPKERVAKVGLVEWIVHHPRCILGKDRDLWQGLFDYAGHEMMSHAYERIGGDSKLWFSTFNDYIHANYEEDKNETQNQA